MCGNVHIFCVFQGMEDLYDFTESHPEIDLKAILSTTSDFFHSYTLRGLKNVARWRENSGANFGKEIESGKFIEKPF